MPDKKTLRSVYGMDVCYGCGVCAATCPNHCITMALSHEGFYVPRVDKKKCVGCGRCVRVCPKLSPPREEEVTRRTLRADAAWLKDKEALRRSTSGGAVTAIAHTLAKQNYGFCGVRYMPSTLCAEHFLAETIEDFAPALGSKYIQSLTQPTFERLLKEDKKWMVVGTPCQIFALRRLLRERRVEERFVLVELQCHGVPSMKWWHAFLRMVCANAKTNPRQVNARWRDKTRGWHDSYQIVLSVDGKPLNTNYAQAACDWMMGFLSQNLQNRPCYACPFRNGMSGADIRVADFWDKTYQTNERGVSRVLALTKRGVKVWAAATEQCMWESVAWNAEATLPSTRRHSWLFSVMRRCKRSLDLTLLGWPKGFRMVATLDQLCRSLARRVHH